MSMIYDTQPILIGADLDMASPVNHWVGALDDLRIYNRALDAQEIAALAAP